MSVGSTCDVNGLLAARRSEFGWGRVRPSWLQWLNRPACFLLLLCLCAVAQSMVVNGLISVSVTTLERRYALSSVQAGWILSAYELAGIPSLLLVSLAGTALHRPRWVGLGMLLLSLGAVLFCLPHFTTPAYKYSANTSEALCQAGLFAGNWSAPAGCAEVGEGSDQSGYLGMFLGAAILMALGAVPIYVLGIPYLDDALTKENSAMYIGILYTSAVVGPAAAYIAGGFILNHVYIDHDNLSHATEVLARDDTRWLGAWWLGFLFAFALMLLVVVPLLGFPSHLPVKDTSNKSLELKSSEVQSVGGVDKALHSEFGASFRDLPKSLKILVRNPTFMFSCLYGACDGIIGAGFTTFGPKYVQNQFGLSAGTASVIFGAVAIPGGAGGYLLGSILTKKMSLSCRQLLRLMVIGASFCLLFVGIFFIRCDNVRFAGVTHTYSGSKWSGEPSLGWPCNAGCQCAGREEDYQPVCGDDGATFFSPCFAGCTDRQADADTQILSSEEGYVNCTCVASPSATVSDGVCPVAGCNLLPLFGVLFFLALFIIFACSIFHVSVIIRCVPSAQRSLALSVDWLGVRIIGSMPGPLLFGAVLDQTCLLWGSSCQDVGSCLYYDNHSMAWYMMAICVPAKVLSIVFGTLAWKLYKPLKTTDTSTETDINIGDTGYGSRNQSTHSLNDGNVNSDKEAGVSPTNTAPEANNS